MRTWGDATDVGVMATVCDIKHGGGVGVKEDGCDDSDVRKVTAPRRRVVADQHIPIH